MRILRGHSSTEVSYRGFALFMLGLIISTFLGGAIRTLLNSDSIQKKFLEEARKKSPDLVIEVGKMQGQLSRGIWPGLVFNFYKVHLIKKSCKGDSYDFEIDQLSAPIQLLSLWRGQPKLGEVSASDVRIKIFKSACAKESVTASVPTPNETAGDKSQIAIVANAKLNLDWTSLRKVAEELKIKKIEISSESEPSLKAILTSFELEIDDELELKADLEIRKTQQFTSLSHRLALKIEADEKVALAEMRGKLKEGSLDWKVQVDLAKQSFNQEITIRQMPVKDVFSELFKAGLLNNEFALRSLWLSCRLNQEGHLADWTAQSIHLRDCKLDGGVGAIQFQDGVLNLKEKKLDRPMLLQVSDLQLAPLLEALKRDTLPEVFSKLGSWSGEAKIVSLEDWSLDGSLRGLEIIFSSQSVRGKQTVTSVKTELSKTPGGVLGKLSHIEFAGGEAAGELNLNLDNKIKSGSIDFNFKNILLGPNIQKLILGGSVKALSCDGNAKLLNGDLETLVGHAYSPEISGTGWQLNKVDMSVVFKNKLAAIKLKAASLHAESAWSQFLAFKSVYEPLEIESIDWQEPNAQLVVSDKGGDLISLSIKDLGKKLRLSAKGSWQRDHDFSGSLTAIGDHSRRNYSVLGREYQLSISAD